MKIQIIVLFCKIMVSVSLSHALEKWSVVVVYSHSSLLFLIISFLLGKSMPWAYWSIWFYSISLLKKIIMLIIFFSMPENWKITLGAMTQKVIYQSCCRPSWQGVQMSSGRKACRTDMYKVVRFFFYSACLWILYQNLFYTWLNSSVFN